MVDMFYTSFRPFAERFLLFSLSSIKTKQITEKDFFV